MQALLLELSRWQRWLECLNTCGSVSLVLNPGLEQQFGKLLTLAISSFESKSSRCLWITLLCWDRQLPLPTALPQTQEEEKRHLAHMQSWKAVHCRWTEIWRVLKLNAPGWTPIHYTVPSVGWCNRNLACPPENIWWHMSTWLRPTHWGQTVSDNPINTHFSRWIKEPKWVLWSDASKNPPPGTYNWRAFFVDVMWAWRTFLWVKELPT